MDRKNGCMKEAKGHTHRMIALALGVPGTIAVIYGLIKLFK